MAIDWSKIYNKYKGQWVAMKSDEKTVVGNGATAREALQKARAKGFEHPILTKMPSELVAYVGVL